MEVHPASKVTSLFGSDHFSGRVWLDPLLEQGGGDGLRIYRVFFEPGSRTHWHTHPGGQSLMILAGTARTGAEGEPAVEAGRLHDPCGVQPGRQDRLGRRP